MKRFVLVLFTALLLIGTAKADNETSVSVYITDTGDCYHRYECEFIQSKSAARLEDVFMDFRPCSFCSPPVVEWDAEKMCFYAKEVFVSSENGPTISRSSYFPANSQPIIISTSELDSSDTKSTQTQPSSRSDELLKEMEAIKNDPLFRDAELRANLQISVKPPNEESIKKFGQIKMGIAEQAGAH